MSEPKRVGVAVSGGGDSMALLHAAHRWSTLSGVPIEAVTVNHGLRGEAADEAALVARVCADWDIHHEVLQWDGTAASGNLAAAGRAARYSLMAKWAKRRKIGGVLLGHTCDDIAETFLMRLARKSGVDGLSVMDMRFERYGLTWARPFWQQERAELRDYLRRNDVPWVEDPTNVNDAYDRPKARKILAELAPLGITADVLKSVALAQRSASQALNSYTYDEALKHARMEAGDVILPRRVPIPSEISRRLWLGALQYIGKRAYAPREHALQDLEYKLSNGAKRTLAGCVVTQDEKEVRFTRELKPASQIQCKVGERWDNRWLVEADEEGFPTDGFTIRALGKAIKEVPDWRDIGLPRATLMVTPAVFNGDTLIAAPVAGLQNGFSARIVADFTSFLVSR